MGADAYDIYKEEVAALRVLVDDLDGDEEVQAFKAGPWLVLAAAHQGQGYPMSLVILPNPDHEGDDGELWAGITTGVLRSVPLAEMAAQYRREKEPQLDARDALALLVTAAAARRRDDRYYAILADAYARLTAAGDTKPLRTISQVSSIGIDTVRGQLRQARKLGMLTGVPGRAGGTVTEKARAALPRTDREPPS